MAQPKTAKEIHEYLTAVFENGGVDPNAKKEPKQPAKPDLIQNAEMFSGNVDIDELYGLTTGLGYKVTRYSDDYWPEEVRGDIPEVDPDYRPDTEALVALVVAIEQGEKPLLVGPSGCGKTALVRHVAAIRRQPYMRVNGSDGADSTSFLGGLGPHDDKSWAWHDGSITQAVKAGYLLAFDEPFKAAPGVHMAMQWLYEDGGRLVLLDKPGTKKDKEVTPHKDFRMVLADNVRGVGDGADRFAATQIQDSSTLDRFGIVIDMDYLDAESETRMLAEKWDGIVNKDAVSLLVQLAGLVRSAYKQGQIDATLSTRVLHKILKFTVVFKDRKKAIKMVYGNRLPDDVNVAKFNDLYKVVYSEKFS